LFLGRRQAGFFDRGRVGEGVVEVADLLFFRRERRGRPGLDPLHDFLHALFAEDREVRKRARARAVRGDDGVFVTGAVRVVEEVVAGLDALVHAGEVNAPGAQRGLLVGRLRRLRRQDSREREDREDGGGLSHGVILQAPWPLALKAGTVRSGTPVTPSLSSCDGLTVSRGL